MAPRAKAELVRASYHYRWLLPVALVVAGCANEERTTPTTEPAVVPSLVGLAAERAVDDVQAAGLRPELEVAAATPSPIGLGECPAGRVASQDAAAGTRLVRGSPVVLTVASCPPTTTPPVTTPPP